MAKTVMRRRQLHNGKRRRRQNLTARQIKFFGTPAQKAQLKRSRAAKRAAASRSNRAIRRRSASHRPRSRPRRNMGEILELALSNPAHERRKKVAAPKRKRSRRRRSSSSGHRRRASRPNPRHFSYGHRRRSRRSRGNPRRFYSRHRRRARGNPGMAAGFGGFVVGAAWAIAGAVGTKMLTQVVLGAQNTGWLGYGANLAAAFILGGVVGMFRQLGGTRARNYVILGGVIQTLLRVLIDQTPFGKRLALSGVGDYQVQGFLTPQRLADGLHSATIDYPPQVRPAPVPVAAHSNGMTGLIGSTSLR